MKVVLLAGGLGTRLSEETDLRPKPMVEIGGRPLLWHIMKIYAASGFADFVVCCGYKGESIKRYFSDYFLLNSDIEVDLASGSIEYINRSPERWKIRLIDTGLTTMTGGRVKRIAEYIGSQSFCLTYGDGVADIDVAEIVAFHRRHGKLATVTAVPSPGRFGILQLDQDDKVQRFSEKPTNEMGYINGGFFVLEPGVLDFIDGDATMFEHEPLQRLAEAGELRAFLHHGFWKPMDTLFDKRKLEDMWASGNAPWKR